MLRDPKRQTGAFSSSRSRRRGLLTPNPNGGASSSDASEGHGYRNEWLHVPSVSKLSFPSQLDGTNRYFLSTLGGAVGLAVGEVIIAIVLPRKLAAIPNIASLGLGNNTSITALLDSVSQVHSIPVRRKYLHP